MNSDTLEVAGQRVGPGQPVYVIAEIGNNHNGDFHRAIALIDSAVEAGADCAKFQMRVLSEVYRTSALEKQGEDLGVEYVVDLLHRFELKPEDHARLAAYCREKGITYLCTPWDAKSARVLADMEVAAFKVASADMTNLPLLKVMADTNRPLIASTGMSTSDEINAVVGFLNTHAIAGFALLHCQSTYPAAFHNINLNFLKTLQGIHPIIGYSGHERGQAVSVAAVALGASILERHITLDRTMEGPDHAASLEPTEFKSLVDAVRQVELALGPKDMPKRILTQGEMINRESLAKSLIAARDLDAGKVLVDDDIVIKSPGQGLSPLRLDELVGKTLGRTMHREDFFYESDIDNQKDAFHTYTFRRPWGIPVRYHDLDAFLKRCAPDFVEFHLSYGDMERSIDDFMAEPFDIGFVVHAPELFKDSMLMELTAGDESQLADSIAEAQRVIDLTRDLKRFFPKTVRPPIVANVGGFSMDAPLPEGEKVKRYAQLAESLGRLDMDGAELIIQTMAPFPWHFGGQRYQNLFLFGDEIAEFCERYSWRICLDVSHSRLASNHFGFDFNEFVETVAPYTAHLHIADASGVDGESVQIGDGNIDFGALVEILDRLAPDATFLPEIWQGHKDSGRGFWTALDKLQGVF